MGESERVCVCVFVHVSVCKGEYACLQVRMCAQVYMGKVMWVCAYMYVYKYICLYIDIHVNIYIYIHIYIHIYIDIHVHMFMYAFTYI